MNSSPPTVAVPCVFVTKEKQIKIWKAKTMDTTKPVIRLDGRETPLDESETGLFGVTTWELKKIILLQLLATKSKSKRQRTLFNMVLKAMEMRNPKKKQEHLYKIYVDVLRELRDTGEIILQAGKNATYVKIP